MANVPNRQRQRLDRRRIVESALELLDEEGLDHVTTRRLADRLAVQSPALYWHVKNKDELLDLMAEAVMEPVVVAIEAIAAKPGVSWRQRMEEGLRAYRGALQSHRDVAQLLTARPPTGTNRLRIGELTVGFVLQSGLPDSVAARLGILVRDMVLALVLLESAAPEWPPVDKIERDPAPELGPAPVPGSDRQPLMERMKPVLRAVGTDDLFDFGLQVILDGAEHQIRRVEKPTRRAADEPWR